MPHSKTYIKQDTQCTYNITLGRIRATIFAMEKQLSITRSKSLCL